MRRRIEPQARDLDDLVAEQRRAPAYHRLDSGEQFAWGEGFGDVIIRSGFEPRYLVRFLRAARQHDDRNVPGALVAAQLPGEAHSGRVGENPIEQHQIRQHLTNGRHGFGYAGRAHHFMSGTLEVNRDQLLSYQLVFDYKYGAAHDLNGLP